MFEDSDILADSPAHELALDCLAAGIDAAHPKRAVERHCAVAGETLRIKGTEYDLSAYDSVIVLGGGKAADDLAAAFETLLGDRIDGGVVVTNERTADPTRVDVLEGEHPTPGEGSVSGARTVLDRAEAADAGTLVIAAIAGGGSALLCAPAPGLSVDDLRAVTDGLLDAGAPIDEINTVRRACSAIKGGGLAVTAAPAPVVGVLVSDVVGDDPSVIASGPTAPTGSDPAAALAVLDRYGLDVSAVRERLDGLEPIEPADVDVENHIIASGRDAIDAAREVATERGYGACVLSTRIEGEATAAGRIHAAIGAEAADSGDPVGPPAVVLSGGETTVQVTGDGVGGPNGEFVLAAASDLPQNAVLAAVDTDGGDGSTDAAGGLVDGRTVDDPEAARAALADNDSYTFLDSKDALLWTGATGTNVNDLRVLVVP
ncbi:glycerate kinase [Natronomonas sp.]|uniref:glycerate kinase type-2 family protein n=1 Tax=Natronomonas sp. TaxID=2184060 RepID=UPI0039751C9D